jgi:4a-hydroxytetrahydrobiopterin dehydratase
MPDLLTVDEIARLRAELDPDWTVSPDQTSIERCFSFDAYLEGVAFANSVAWIAEKHDHHPDLLVGYARCEVVYSTHSAGGLTQLDFDAARAVDQLVEA